MKRRPWGLFGLILSIYILKTDGACTFPTDVVGVWDSSAKGSITFTSSGITAYTTKKFGSLDFTCDFTYNDYYIAKSASFAYHSIDFELYACFYFVKQSDYKYIYYLVSTENSDADNERIKGYQVGTSVTGATICDRPSLETGQYSVLVKSGYSSTAKIECPSEFHGTWLYTYNSGSGAVCGNDSEVDVCTSPDTTTLTYNYTKCSTVQAFSATGVLFCMQYATDATLGTYLHLYNTDSSPDESTTYRFTCLLFSVNGDGDQIYATQYPQDCLSSQTSISVSSPGATLVFNQTASCATESTSSADSPDVSTASIAAGIIVGLLVLIAIVVCGFLIYKHYKKRKQEEEVLTKKIHQHPVEKQPANKRLILTNGDLVPSCKTPETSPRAPKSAEVKVDIDTDPTIMRENSIHVSVMRGESAASGVISVSRGGPAPVEEPDKVKLHRAPSMNFSEYEKPLASTFLPITSAERDSKFHEKEIKVEESFVEKESKFREIEIKVDHASPANDSKFHEKETKVDKAIMDHYIFDKSGLEDMDAIDDELGLPRISAAPGFEPIVPQDPDYKTKIKIPVTADTEEPQDVTAAGIKKVKLKTKKKKRKVTAKKDKVKAEPTTGTAAEKDKIEFEHVKRSDSTPKKDKVKPQPVISAKSAIKSLKIPRRTPFLQRIRKQEKAQKAFEEMTKEMEEKQNAQANGVIQSVGARDKAVSKDARDKAVAKEVSFDNIANVADAKEVIKARVRDANLPEPADTKIKRERKGILKRAKSPKKRYQKPVVQEAQVSTWWTKEELKKMNVKKLAGQIKDMCETELKKEIDTSVKKRPKVVVEKVENVHLGSDIPWKLKPMPTKYRTKTAAARHLEKLIKQQNRGKAAFSSTPSPSKKTPSTTETTSSLQHPLSLKIDLNNPSHS